jgi:type II secretory pathway predicted ATPase ExeA
VTDPRPPFRFEDFSLALEELRAALAERRRYVLLTGESGCGKTTLLRELSRTVEEGRVRLFYFNIARLSPAGLVRVLARSLRAHVGYTCSETVRAVTEILFEEKCHALVVADEAQMLPDDTFAGLRTLAEDDLSGRLPITVLFAGLAELEERLKGPALFPLWRRIPVRLRIGGLRDHEMRPLLVWHVGEQDAARFPDETVSLLFERGRGLPGLVLPAVDLLLRRIREGLVRPEAALDLLDRFDRP